MKIYRFQVNERSSDQNTFDIEASSFREALRLAAEHYTNEQWDAIGEVCGYIRITLISTYKK